MLDNNQIFIDCIPSVKDYILVENHMVLLNEISYVNISFDKSATIAVLVPLTVQPYLSVFRHKAAIELSPIECDMAAELYINENIIYCNINKITYQSHEHKYLFFINFRPSSLKIYSDNIKASEKNKPLDTSDLGEIIDLE